MKRRPKDIGTHAETAVLHVVQQFWPRAQRNILHGAKDEGDIGHCGPFVFEVKGGDAARDAGPGLIAEWMEQARREAANAGRGFGILVTQRRGFGEQRAAGWWAYIPIEHLARLMGTDYVPAQPVPIRMELWALLCLLADFGHVDPEAM